MHFGLCLPNNQGVPHISDLVGLAVEAEALGYDSVWVSDHIFHASYVAARLGDKPYHDPLTVLTAVACATERVSLATSVLVLPWHHPIRLAKILASLDELSGGRVILGVGVGETADEYANVGVDFSTRGRYTDEILEALRRLWADDLPRFSGEFLAFEGLRFEPKPVQAPGIPIWVGGGGTAAFRRTVEFGSGWHPLSTSASRIAEGLAKLEPALRARGRSAAELRVGARLVLEFMDDPWDRPVDRRRTCRGTPAEIVAMVQAYRAAGATDFIVDAGTGDLDAAALAYRRFRRDVIEQLPGEGV